MSALESITRPKRWLVPYADELLGSRMSAEIAKELLAGTLKDLAEDHSRFPPDLPLLDILRCDARLVSFQKGGMVIRQGDYGDSAFVIVKGSVDVLLHPLPPTALGHRDTERPGIIRTIARALRKKSPYPESRRKYRKPDAEEGLGQFVHLSDFPEFLLAGSKDQIDPDSIDTMAAKPDQAGEVFGEIAALSRTPRTATVLAAEDETVLLEIRWQGLRDIRKFSPRWKKMIDDRYASSSLVTHLRNAQFTSHLSRKRDIPNPDSEWEAEDEFISELDIVARQTRFFSYGEFSWQSSFKQMAEEGNSGEREPEILKQGSIASDLILIRSGFVRVTRRFNHGEKTVAYLGKGQVFGLMELYHNHSEKQKGETQKPYPYQHSLRAVGYVDTLAIPAPVVETYIIPKLTKAELRQLDHEVAALAKEGKAPVFDLEAKADGQLLEFFLERRAINGTAAMFIDLDRCTRCDDCIRACADTHDGNPRFNRIGPAELQLQFTHACLHCVDPVCMIGCPTGAIHRDPNGNQVVINEYTCIGCSTCADNCAYDNIQMVEIRDGKGDFIPGTTLTKSGDYVRSHPQEAPVMKATKCDLCIDQLTGPACYNACPHDALIRADMANPDSFLKWLNRP